MSAFSEAGSCPLTSCPARFTVPEPTPPGICWAAADLQPPNSFLLKVPEEAGAEWPAGLWAAGSGQESPVECWVTSWPPAGAEGRVCQLPGPGHGRAVPPRLGDGPLAPRVTRERE